MVNDDAKIHYIFHVCKYYIEKIVNKSILFSKSNHFQR